MFAHGLVWLLCCAAAASRPNVLLLVVDDLRSPAVGAFSDPQAALSPALRTPALDSLAARSTLLARAFCQQGVCSPSRNSFMSGRRPDVTKVWNFKSSFRDLPDGPRWTALPQAFKRAGYRTAGLGKVYHPGQPAKDDCADFPTDCASWSEPYYHAVNKPCSRVVLTDNLTFTQCDMPDERFIDGNLTSQAERLIDQFAMSPGRPFFLALGLHKPHVPWLVPSRFFSQQLPAHQMPLPAFRTLGSDVPPLAYYLCEFQCGDKAQPESCFNATRPLPDAAIQQRRWAYAAASSWMDHLIGRVLRRLEAAGLARNTVIVFVSDHGWHLGEHSMWCKQSNFELVARVPALIHVPWLPQSHGRRSKALVELIDIYPTLLDLAGIKPPLDPQPLDGVSFMPVLQANESLSGKAHAFSQYPRCYADNNASKPIDVGNQCTMTPADQFAVMGYSVRSESFRLTRWMGWNSSSNKVNWSDVRGVELYSHAGEASGIDGDRYENVNLAGSPSQQVVERQLTTVLRDFVLGPKKREAGI